MNKFTVFLVITLGLTAFLGGYIVLENGIGGIKTGTILEGFSNQEINDKDQSKEDAIDKKSKLISNRQVVSVVKSANGNGIIYFEKNTGKIFEYDLKDNNETSISDETIPNFISAVWSPDKKQTLNHLYHPLGDRYQYFNVETGKVNNLDANIRSTAFSPDGNLIAFHYLEPGTNPNPIDPALPPINKTGKIAISEPDGTYQKKVIDTRLTEIEISWPTREKMALKTPLSEIYLLNENGELKKMLEPGYGLEYKWSPNGLNLLFSNLIQSQNGLESLLFIKNIETDAETSIDMLNVAGAASLCVWSIDNTHIYCALSKSPSVDIVHKINTQDKTLKIAAEPNALIKEILLSTLEDYILYVNASDGKLYSIKVSD